MADNKQVGSGAPTFTAATDEIAGADYQFIKVVDGTARSSVSCAFQTTRREKACTSVMGRGVWAWCLHVVRLPAELTALRGSARYGQEKLYLSVLSRHSSVRARCFASVV